MPKFKEPQNYTLITQPVAPPEEEMFQLWHEVMNSGWITNMGKQHDALEKDLAEYLGVKHIDVFNNGTLALIIALKALGLPEGSEVITTPFTFAATTHAIAWNGLKPVFADITPDTMTLDPAAIEKAITPNTSAILPVHVYGFPCDVEAIEAIAKKHGLKVLYDGAHAFTTEINGKSICEWGDITMLSFHATKLFNTIEGGALVYKDEALGKTIYELRNFGIKKFDNTEEIKEGIKTSSIIDEVGINGKMNEFQAAWGRLVLQKVKAEQEERRKVAETYRAELGKHENITIPDMPEGVTNSMQYFPVLFNEQMGETRDEVYDRLMANNILSRKYFYPLCSEFGCYRNLPSAQAVNLPVAHSIANRVLCLPFYGELHETGQDKRICDLVINKQATAATNAKTHQPYAQQASN